MLFNRLTLRGRGWLMVVICTISFNTTATTSFELLGVTTKAGQKNSYLATEGAITLPVTVVNGLQPGPVLLLTAGIHGDEFPSMLALQSLRTELDPADIKGTVVLLHLANLPGFHGRRLALSPEDEKNLNRVFPGKKNGTSTEQVAELLTREFISRIDFLVDMHSGSSNQHLLPHVYSPFVGDDKLDTLTFEFAKATGMKNIVLYGDRPRDPNNSISYPNTAMTRGKPGLTTEIGHLGQRDEEFVEQTLTVARNTLYFLKMLPGEPAYHPDPVIYDRLTSVSSPADGFFTPLVKIGDEVETGTVVGEVTDYFGNLVERLKSPVSGTILMISQTPPIKTGEPPVTIGIKAKR